MNKQLFFSLFSLILLGLLACGLQADEYTTLGQQVIGDCSVTLSSNPSSPQNTGTTITWTASASCIDGTPEYKFYLRNPAGSWSLPQDWSTSPTLSWNTSNLKSGTYLVQVWTRRQGQTSALEGASPSAPFELTGGIGNCSSAITSKSVESPQAVSTNITFQYTANCAGGSAEYLLYHRPPGGSWRLEHSWQTTNNFVWSTSSETTGIHIFQLWTRAQGSSEPYQATDIFSYTLQEGKCHSLSATANPTSPQAKGATIAWTLSAQCDGGITPEYLVYRRKPSGSWVLESNWNTNSTFTWNTTSSETGTHAFQFWVRGVGRPVTYDAVTPTVNYELTSQTPWVNYMTSTDSPPTPSDIEVDTNGNVIIVGGFTKDMTAGTTTISDPSLGGGFIGKLDTNGVWKWLLHVGNPQSTVHYSPDVVWGITIDTNNNIYITGHTTDIVSFGTTSLNGTFIAKLDTNGNWIWAHKTNTGVMNDIALDTSGNIYTTGEINDNIGIMKFNSSGTMLWSASGINTNSSGKNGYNILIDSVGASYIIGQVEGTTTFGTITITASTDTYIIAKVDTNGNWLWVKTLPSNGNIALDSQKNLYISGYFSGTQTYGTTQITAQGTQDLFVAKVDTNGNWLWAKSAGGSGATLYGLDIHIDDNDSVFLAGSFFGGQVSFGTTPLTSAGLADVFIAKLDTNGNWQTAIRAGDTQGESIQKLKVRHGQAHSVGYFKGPTTLGNLSLPSTGTATQTFVWRRPAP